MGNICMPCNCTVAQDDLQLECLIECAHQLEDSFDVIRKREIIDALLEKDCFDTYHKCKEFVLMTIPKALQCNQILETTIYLFNPMGQFEFLASRPDEACAINNARKLHKSHGFFTRLSLINKMCSDKEMMNTDYVSVSHLIGHFICMGLESKLLVSETAYNLKYTLHLAPLPCHPVNQDSTLTEAVSSDAEIHLNTCS